MGRTGGDQEENMKRTGGEHEENRRRAGENRRRTGGERRIAVVGSRGRSARNWRN